MLRIGKRQLPLPVFNQANSSTKAAKDLCTELKEVREHQSLIVASTCCESLHSYVTAHAFASRMMHMCRPCTGALLIHSFRKCVRMTAYRAHCLAFVQQQSQQVSTCICLTWMHLSQLVTTLHHLQSLFMLTVWDKLPTKLLQFLCPMTLGQDALPRALLSPEFYSRSHTAIVIKHHGGVPTMLSAATHSGTHS